MPTFASLEELSIYSGKDIAVDDPGALLALQLATDMIQAETFNTIFQTTETIKMDGDGRGLLLLPSPPIISIDMIKEDGVELEENVDYFVNYKTGYIYRNKPSLIIISSYWLDQTGTAIWSGRTPANIEITFTHGYPIVPGVVKMICLSVADRIKQIYPSNIRTESIGSYSVTFNNATLTLNDNEKQALDPYRNVQAY